MQKVEQGVIKFKVLKAKSQKANVAQASARNDFDGRASVNTMEDSGHLDVDIENISDPQIQVVY
jgi:hypothetical protein